MMMISLHNDFNLSSYLVMIKVWYSLCSNHRCICPETFRSPRSSRTVPLQQDNSSWPDLCVQNDWRKDTSFLWQLEWQCLSSQPERYKKTQSCKLCINFTRSLWDNRVFQKLPTIQECQYYQLWFSCAIGKVKSLTLKCNPIMITDI